ncbi:hypothetical protein BLA29_005491 [Euroglyphus maynei]|uniref:Uncharacterized protein n=1 Tax=Euroglyphus maynei TaxID=6958 RepID=A0A1Y3BFT4_EURMA|nr:hypothetical protein BLA29_005491 [Euroglyphus maynei]
MLLERCGEYSQRMFLAIIEYNSLSILNTICPRDEYDYGSEQCDPLEFHAPNDYHPKVIIVQMLAMVLNESENL